MRRPVLPLILILVFACALSCRVKEDRDACPNLLTIALHRAARQMAALEETDLRISVRSGSVFRSGGTVDPGDYADGLAIPSPRGTDEVSAYTGARRSVEDGDRLVLPEGAEADSLFAHAATVDCSGDAAYDTVVLHKQFATLTVVLRGFPTAPPSILEADGSWNGTDLYSLAPVRGPFHARFRQQDAATYRLRVPRQGDSGLALLLYGSGAQGRGDLLGRFSVGSAIVRSGYDWGAADLPDIHITLDHAFPDVRVSIVGWESGGTHDYNI